MYRKIIPLLAARHRVIAMFFIGFGRSNKFTDAGEYTLSAAPRHPGDVHQDSLP
jgi:pimeloyl-ACP methyl ester carboxylesterase